jgi:hypothetical protein
MRVQKIFRALFLDFFAPEKTLTNRNIFSATAQKFYDTASWLKRKRLRPLRKRRSNVLVTASSPLNAGSLSRRFFRPPRHLTGAGIFIFRPFLNGGGAISPARHVLQPSCTLRACAQRGGQARHLHQLKTRD